MSPFEARTVDRDPVHVRYVEVADDAQAIATGWASLEDAVGTMRGRRFLAVIADDRYRACVEQITDVTTAEQRLPTLVVPGGAYRRVRLHGEPPGIYEQIAPAAAFLGEAPDCDPQRPILELYLRRDRIDVLMPVRGGGDASRPARGRR